MSVADFIGNIPPRSGIYLILHKATSSVYVGQSLNIRNRLVQHYESLATGSHYNTPLQRLWSTYPPESFSTLLHMLCPQGLSPLSRQRWLVKAERETIEVLKRENNVLNQIDPEIVETPDAIAEFLVIKAAQDKAKAARDKERATSTSRKRREIKVQLEQLHQRLAPLRIQRRSTLSCIAQREVILRKSKNILFSLFGRPSEESISEQEVRLTALRNQLCELEAVLDPGERECARLTEEYRRLYLHFPKVEKQLDRRIASKTPWAFDNRNKPTVIE